MSTILIQKAFKYRLKPNKEQDLLFRKTNGCVRYVWNKALFEIKSCLNDKHYPNYFENAKKLTFWKQHEDNAFLKEVAIDALQQILIDLDRACKDGFKKEKGFPRFKKKGKDDRGFRFPANIKIDGDHIFLPKAGWVKFQNSRKIKGEIRNATVTYKAGHWYVSVQTQFEKKVKERKRKKIGVDFGVTKLATLSNGHQVEPINALRKFEKILAKEQRSLARKQKDSNRYNRKKLKAQKVYKKITDVRRDYLHKFTSNLSKSHAVIVIEDLRVSNMSKSAKGTIEEPGVNVKAKSGLNKSILDQGWFEARQMLEYKQRWSGGKLVVVPAQYTSQKCSKCGHTEKANRRSQAVFKCQSCGLKLNADYNASLNILAAGNTVLASGDISSVAS